MSKNTCSCGARKTPYALTCRKCFQKKSKAESLVANIFKLKDHLYILKKEVGFDAEDVIMYGKVLKWLNKLHHRSGGFRGQD